MQCPLAHVNVPLGHEEVLDKPPTAAVNCEIIEEASEVPQSNSSELSPQSLILLQRFDSIMHLRLTHKK